MAKKRISNPMIEEKDLLIIDRAAKLVGLDRMPFIISAAKRAALDLSEQFPSILKEDK